MFSLILQSTERSDCFSFIRSFAHSFIMSKKTTCEIFNCGLTFYDADQLKQHVSLFHRPPCHTLKKKCYYACAACPRKFSNRSCLYKHEDTAHSRSCYPCPYCHKSYRYHQSRYQHLKRWHAAAADIRIVQSPVLIKPQPQSMVSSLHRQQPPPQPQQQQQQQQQQRTFSTMSTTMTTADMTNDIVDILESVKQLSSLASSPTLSPSPPPPPPSTPTPCLASNCRDRDVDSNNKLFENASHPCQLCVSTFEGKVALMVHIKMAHSMFQCSFCNAVFFIVYNLKKHVQTVHPDRFVDYILDAECESF